MGSFKFELIIYGGLADDPDAKVSAAKLGAVLRGLDRDVQEFGRNFTEGDALPAEGVSENRVYVEGPPTKGQSLAVPLSGDELFVRGYAAGVMALRDSNNLASEHLPRGLSPAMLQRISGYSGGIIEEHGGFRLALPAVNGTPKSEAVYDAQLKTAINLKIAAISHAEQLKKNDRAAVDNKTYGYTIQGVLYELSDPKYEDPGGRITVEINTRDGHKWACHLDKSLAPDNLQDLWRTEVLVHGDAIFRPQKNIIEAKSFRALKPMNDPVGAMKRLVALCGDTYREIPVQAYMDRVRERP